MAAINEFRSDLSITRKTEVLETFPRKSRISEKDGNVVSLFDG